MLKNCSTAKAITRVSKRDPRKLFPVHIGIDKGKHWAPICDADPHILGWVQDFTGLDAVNCGECLRLRKEQDGNGN